MRRREILECALALAEEEGWDQVRLRRLAARLELPLAEVAAHYRDLDALADTWFASALAAMLAPPPEGFDALPARERLHLLLMRWFDALAGHRLVTGQMLSTKLYPSHPHHWVPMIFNLSRTIQWLRDAAGLDAPGLRRQAEEVGLTGLFLATLGVWLRDDSPGQERTRAFLARGLGAADRALGRVERLRRTRARGSDRRSWDPVLDFWFAEGMAGQWFKKDPAFDADVRRQLQTAHEAAAAGRCESWLEDPRGALALCILLDQAPRNLYRDTPRAYAWDAAALRVTREAIARGHDRELSQVERWFLYLPLEHSESLADQEDCVRLIETLDENPQWLDYAVRHRDIIARFGRFPHRNAVLGRVSTEEEEAFLSEPGSSF